MKALIPLVFAAIACSSFKVSTETGFKEGDILFQSGSSRQSQAIQLATHSHFSHTGVLIQKNGKLMVAEAVQPVRYTSIKDWIAHGKQGYYEQRRLKTGSLPEASLVKMRSLADKYEGKDYDSYFEWSDDKMYCSELVWKIYNEGAGMELCPLKKFKDYDFSNALVKEELKKRYGNNIPTEEKIVSPEDVYKSPKLVKAQ